MADDHSKKVSADAPHSMGRGDMEFYMAKARNPRGWWVGCMSTYVKNDWRVPMC